MCLDRRPSRWLYQVHELDHRRSNLRRSRLKAIEMVLSGEFRYIAHLKKGLSRLKAVEMALSGSHLFDGVALVLQSRSNAVEMALSGLLRWFG